MTHQEQPQSHHYDTDSQSHDEQWFVDWFNHHFYATVYRHRTQQDADRAVGLFLRAVQPQQGERVLDVCCGAGRHLRALLDAGLQVAGLDLSAMLLAMAQETVGDAAKLYQSDMREQYPQAFDGGRYDCVTNFFTSFGYFQNHDDNCAVMRRVAESLQQGGWFFFDFLNAHAIADTLIPEDTRIVEDMTVVQRRWIADGFVKKEITVIDRYNARHEFTEQVRLYTMTDIQAMLDDVGLQTVTMFGDYDGSPHTERSPRLIVTARLL
jgi:SAM-dependent methyltransferase